MISKFFNYLFFVAAGLFGAWCWKWGYFKILQVGDAARAVLEQAANR